MRRLPLTLLFFSLFSGCETMQWIAPHQLWKLNRQPAVGGEDGYFSIPAAAVPDRVRRQASAKTAE